MLGLEQKAKRHAESRNQAAAVVEKRSASEIGACIRNYREGGVLTGRDTEYEGDELLAAAFELIDDLYGRLEVLERAEKSATKPTTKTAKSTGGMR